MAQSHNPTHEEAYKVLAKGLLHPSQMNAARNNSVLKPILDKLSEPDIETLRNIAQAAESQQGTVHDP